jgi:phosphoserine aminotransferase
MTITANKPKNVKFGSGPTRKNPSWSLHSVCQESLGCSHRGVVGLRSIKKMLSLLREVLQIPPTHHIAILNGGGTGAFEFLLWNLLSENTSIDVFSAGIFGNLWQFDIANELRLKNYRSFCSNIGESPNFQAHEQHRDCVFVFTETTAGTNVPNLDWIGNNRTGLSICDATAAAFCTQLQWEKLDATSFSLQKGIGGEGGLGVIVINDRAIERLNSLINSVAVPTPRLLRVPRLEDKSIDMSFFDGYCINTISLLTVEDANTNLTWAKEIGGLCALVDRVNENYEAVKCAISELKMNWLDFLVKNESIRAKNISCLKINCCDEWELYQKISNFLFENDVAVDILNHKKSKPALRIWCGPTVDVNDIQALMPWLNEAYAITTQS